MTICRASSRRKLISAWHAAPCLVALALAAATATLAAGLAGGRQAAAAWPQRPGLAGRGSCTPTWQIMPGAGTGSSALTAIAAVSSRDVWAVGSAGIGSTERPLAIHWDGARWHALSGPALPETQAAPFNPDAIGTTLTGVAAPSAGAVWVVGTRATAGGTRPLVARWANETRTWRLMTGLSAGRDGALHAIAAASPDDIWAVGNVAGTRTLAEHWDGRHWRAVSMPPVSGHDVNLSGVVALSKTDVWAVGSRGSLSDGSRRALIEHWNGTRWRVVASPQPGAVDDALTGISAGSPSNIWAVGTTEGNDYENVLLVERWDGKEWRVVPRPTLSSGQSGLSAIAVLPSAEVWVAAGPVLARWTGARWQETTLSTSSYKAGGNYATASSADFTALTAIPGGGLWAVGRIVENTDQQYTALTARYGAPGGKACR